MTPSGSPPDSPRDDLEIPTLPQEIAPPAGLEDAVVTGLTRHGLLGRGPRHVRRWSMAAAVLLLITGFAAGRWSTTRGPADNGARFVFLLEETPATAPVSPENLQRQIDANREWAHHLAAEGHLVVGEKLGSRGYAISVDSGATNTTPVSKSFAALGGLFVVQAANLDEALALARGAPHVGYGGRIIVRPVDPT